MLESFPCIHNAPSFFGDSYLPISSTSRPSNRKRQKLVFDQQKQGIELRAAEEKARAAEEAVKAAAAAAARAAAAPKSVTAH